MSRTVDFLGHRVVGNFGDVGVAVVAFDITVNAAAVMGFIHIVIPAFAVLIDAADITILVAHQAVFLIGSSCLRCRQQKSTQDDHRQTFKQKSLVRPGISDHWTGS